MEEIGFKYVISSSGNSSSPPFYGFNIGYCYVLELPLDLIFLPCFKHSQRHLVEYLGTQTH